MRGDDAKHAGQRRRILVTALVWVTLCVSRFTPVARATASPEEIFKSIQDNVGHQSQESGKGFALLLSAAGALVLALMIGSRFRHRQARPKVMDHPGKLLKEILKTTPLKPKELKQLKLLAEETRQSESEAPVQSPLTLILCPSVLARVIKNSPAKVDREVLAQLIRKMGVAR